LGAAVKLLKKSCDAGLAQGCAGLGHVYSMPVDWNDWTNVFYDRVRAHELFERVCNGNIKGLGCDSGCGELADELGYLTAQDMREEMRLRTRSCDAGCMWDCSYAADELRKLQDPSLDARAAQLYQRACDIGHTPSCIDLGKMYLDGVGVPQDRDHARRLFIRGCRQSEGEVHECQGDRNAGPLLGKPSPAPTTPAVAAPARATRKDDDFPRGPRPPPTFDSWQKVENEMMFPELKLRK
jgi:TPR repeat protein